MRRILIAALMSVVGLGLLAGCASSGSGGGAACACKTGCKCGHCSGKGADCGCKK